MKDSNIERFLLPPPGNHRIGAAGVTRARWWMVRLPHYPVAIPLRLALLPPAVLLVQTYDPQLTVNVFFETKVTLTSVEL